ncbi:MULTISPECIES: bacteriocin [Leuconostoc]|uniref:Bacteriocin n=2 Tax=Leuconostoc kimchii TaxID=136609 RepID=D5T1T7_LEUKI|nr:MULTISPECIES: bacteriocin [Leuconostoc]ADG40236.1 hypothetical protein LKI_03470 [Leuconostoc kimchii IMSNU 11154]AEJ31824.1 hypothetical protein LGMK_08875 [Leuconostoc sp. C2]QBR46747.1 bacteriocin [Leuconostoc kimchii]
MFKIKSLSDKELAGIVGGGWGGIGIGVIKNWRGEVSAFKRGYRGENY